MKRWIPLIALLCLALLPACAGALELAYQQPKEADLSGTNVNLRSAPSTGAQTLGRFADRADAGELLVLAESKDESGNLWYRVIGARHGEGWVFGKYVSILPDAGFTAAVCRRVRAMGETREYLHQCVAVAPMHFLLPASGPVCCHRYADGNARAHVSRTRG